MFKMHFSKRAFSLIELSIVILIVGILIAGLVASNQLMAKIRVATARNLTIASPIASIKDLALWLEPTMGNSFYGIVNGYDLANNEAVSLWNDLNPVAVYKMNFSQNTTSARPTYKESGIGQLPSLYFDGSSDYLSSSLGAIPAGYKQYTIIAVWRGSNIAYGTVRSVFTQRGASCGGAGIATSSNSLRGLNDGCSAASSVLAIASDISYASIYRVDNNQSNNVTLYSNGTKYGPVAKTTTITTATESDIGYGFGEGGASYLQGFISEVIVYNRALTVAEITDIRKYLTQKYGFAA